MSDAIRTVGVAGAGGTMGAGIAIVAARAGFRTIAYDVEAAALNRARRQTESFLMKSVERGKLTREELERIVESFVQTTELADLGACDLVIEAVFEDLATKQSLFKALHEVCPEKTIFASNTSTLSITEMAVGLRPRGPGGRHAFLPAGAADEADRALARPEHQRRDATRPRGPGARRPARRRSGPRTGRASS